MSYALKARLAAAKTKAAENAAKLETMPHLSAMLPADWRAVARDNARRRFKRPTVWNPAYTDSRGRVWRWLEDVSASGLILAVENATEEANGNRTTGYYVDAFQDETTHGAVLATRDPESPKARFFEAVADPHNAGAYRVLWAPGDDLRAAVHGADREAEREAEDMREHDSAWQAGAAWARHGEEIQEARREALQILKDRRGASGSATLCAVIREKVESLLDSIREAREARESLASGDGEPGRESWELSFWSASRSLRLAFNDGAGRDVLAVSEASPA